MLLYLLNNEQNETFSLITMLIHQFYYVIVTKFLFFGILLFKLSMQSLCNKTAQKSKALLKIAPYTCRSKDKQEASTCVTPILCMQLVLKIVLLLN